MMRSYPLTDYEAHIVRETPELGWPDDVMTEAQARHRLPIDLPAIDDNTPTPQTVSPAVFRIVIGAGLLIALCLWVMS